MLYIVRIYNTVYTHMHTYNSIYTILCYVGNSSSISSHLFFRKLSLMHFAVLDSLHFHMIFKSIFLQKMLILAMNVLNIQVSLEDLDLNAL